MVAQNRVIPRNNPLEHDEPQEVMEAAARFWKEHNLTVLVSQQEFELGALVFQNLSDALAEIDHGITPSSRFSGLDDQQKESITAYVRRYNRKGNRVKLAFFSVVDALVAGVHAFTDSWRNRKSEDNSRPGVAPSQQRVPPVRTRKSKWEYLKDLSPAQLQILMTCIVAAVTQMGPSLYEWYGPRPTEAPMLTILGANLGWPSAFRVPLDDFSNQPTTHPIIVFSALNAAPWFSGALFAFFVSDPVINEFALGRRWSILIAGICSSASVIGAAFTTNWKTFLVCRVLLGLGMGAKASVVSVYISEIVPEQVRGILAMFWQLFDTFGILLGSLANFTVFSRRRSDPDWRWMIGLPSIPALLLIFLAIFCVESPRWLLKHGKIKEALQASMDLHSLPRPITACGELYLTFRRLKEEEEVFSDSLDDTKQWWRRKLHRNPQPAHGTGKRTSNVDGHELEATKLPQTDHSPKNNTSTSQSRSLSKATIPSSTINGSLNEGPLQRHPERLKSTSWLERVGYLFLVPRMRNAIYASLCVMIAQQACGINIFAFLSATIFQKRLIKWNPTERDNRKSLEYTIYFALSNHLFTWVAIPLIDRNGRRWLLHYSFLGMAGCLAVIAGCANIEDELTRERVFIAFTVIFTAVFSIGEGPSAFLVSCEAFPLIVRELGMSHAVFWNFAGAGVISFLIPIMDSRMDDSWFWALFIFFNLLFWRLSQFFVRETQGFALEHIDETYSMSKLDHEENEKMVEVRVWKRLVKRRVRGDDLP